MTVEREIVRFQIILAVGLTIGATWIGVGLTTVYFSLAQDMQVQSTKLAVATNMLSFPELMEQDKKLIDSLDENAKAIQSIKETGYAFFIIGAVIFCLVVVKGIIFMRKL